MKRSSLEDGVPKAPAKKPKIDAAALKAKLANTMSKVQKLRETTAGGVNRQQQQQQEPAAAVPALASISVASTSAAVQLPEKPAEVEEVTAFDPDLNVRRNRKQGLNLFQVDSVPREHQDTVQAHQDSLAALQRSAGAAPSSPSHDAIERLIDVRAAREPPPEVEWWDAAILAQPLYADATEGKIAIKENKITNLVEHPVPIEPPVEAPPPAPQPLKLTKKEMKKIRKQRRQTREQEKQRNMQVGLLEPPPPKVRLKNMHRVYGADGVIDATAIELKVREAQQEREAAHRDRNLANKLTTEERKDKKMRRMFDNTSLDTHVEVFRINELQDGRHLYKIDVNAVENHLTGVCVTTTVGCNVVVVEGDSKGIRRFNRLMLHRIDWNPLLNVDAGDDEMFEEPNKCSLVWKGTVTKAAFSGFSTHKFVAEQEAREFLLQRGVVPYWDAAQSFEATAHIEAA